jgi:hypothetical protein
MDLFEIVGAALSLQSQVDLDILGGDLPEALQPAALPVLQDVLGQHLGWSLLQSQFAEALLFFVEGWLY